MGSTLGGIFNGQNSNGTPLSTGQDILGGLLQGGIGATGSALKPKSQSAPPISAPGAPSATPVDASYFAPTPLNQGSSALYGGR